MGLEILSITDPSKAQIKRAGNFKNMAKKGLAAGTLAATTLGMGACGGAPKDPGSITGPKPQSAIEQKFLSSYMSVLAPDSNLTSAPTTISYTEFPDTYPVDVVETLDPAASTDKTLTYKAVGTDPNTGAVFNGTRTYTIGPDGNLRANVESASTIKGGINYTITPKDGYVNFHNNTKNVDEVLKKKVRTGVVGEYNPSTMQKDGEVIKFTIDGKLISLKKKVKTLGEQLMDAAKTRFGKSLGSEELATKAVRNLSKMA